MLTHQIIADHLYLSTRAVIDFLAKNGLDHKSMTLDEVREAYIKKQREVAAGRGSEELQNEALIAKIENDRESALEKKLKRMQLQGGLMTVEDFEKTVIEFINIVAFQLSNLEQVIQESIESKYGIELDEETVGGHIRAAAERISSAAPQLAECLEK